MSCNQLHIRVRNEQTFNDFKTFCDERRITMTDFIGSTINFALTKRKTHFSVPQKPQAKTKLSKKIESTQTELNKIGTNINQIAHALNVQSKALDIKFYEKELNSISKTLLRSGEEINKLNDQLSSFTEGEQDGDR